MQKGLFKFLPDDYELEENYAFHCPTCGHALRAKPSMMMTEFCLNTGGGDCPICLGVFHLEIDTEKQGRMIAKDWITYVNEG